jgi:hypothetical protein
MDIKNEKELIEWVYDMHLQNLSGREDFVDAFKKGIEATIEELKELKFLNKHIVIKGAAGAVCDICDWPYEKTAKGTKCMNPLCGR